MEPLIFEYYKRATVHNFEVHLNNFRIMGICADVNYGRNKILRRVGSSL
jgi:hypothetical protein